MSYTPTIWENGKKPAINATNLNKIENELAKLDNIVSMPDITETTETTIPNSYDGRLLVEEIWGGESQQNTTAGNQLFDGALEQGTYDGSLNKVSNDYRVRNANSIVVNSNEIYTISSSVAKQIALYELDESGRLLATLSSWGSLPVTFTTSSNGKYIAFALRISDSTAITPSMVNDVMLVKGTKTLPYEPYTGGQPSPNPSYPQEIKKTVVSEIRTHGKNLFDVSKITEGKYLHYANGSEVGNAQYFYSDYIRVESGKRYVISGVTSDAHICIYNEQRVYTSGMLNSVISVSENGYVRFSASVSDKGKIQVEEGTVATEYEPYTESAITLSQPIELYNRNGVEDVIEGGKTKRKFGVAVFNGSEGWGLDSASGRMYTFAYQGKWKGSPSNDAVADALCSHYKVKTPNDTYSKKEGFAVSANGGITIYDARFSDVESFKAWLAQNPITIICRLATPTTEELPLADQIALNSLSTYDGITYLEFDSEIEPTFKGEYGTSKLGGYTLEGMLAGRNGELYGKNYVDRITALEATVVNNI